MTVQTASAGSDLLLLLTVAAIVALSIAALALLARGRPGSALSLAAIAGALALIYGGALLGLALATAPQQMMPGDTKCFDDWCATMLRAGEDPPGIVTVELRLENRSRGRAMRSDLARAYLELVGGREVPPRNGERLQSLLQAGEHRDVELIFPAPRSLHGARFVVTESTVAIGPGTFEIGGEGSPFHAKAGWPL